MLGLEKVDFKSSEDALANIDKVDEAIDKISDLRSYYCSCQNLYDYLGSYFENVYDELNNYEEPNETSKAITKIGLNELKDIFMRIKELEESLKYFVNENTIKSLTQEIEILSSGINILIDECEFKGKYLLKGDYLETINLSIDTLGQNGNLYMTFTSEEEIDKSIDDITFAINKIQSMIDLLNS